MTTENTVDSLGGAATTTVDVSWTFGNFEVTATCEITAAQVRAMLVNGCKQVLQRSPATAAEKALVEADQYEGAPWEVGKKGGLIRPEGFERSSIPFSEENVETLKAGFGREAALETKALGKLKFAITKVTKHEGGETSPMKQAERFVDSLLTTAETRSKLELLLEAYNVEGVADMTREKLIEACHANGLGMRKASGK